MMSSITVRAPGQPLLTWVFNRFFTKFLLLHWAATVDASIPQQP